MRNLYKNHDKEISEGEVWEKCKPIRFQLLFICEFGPLHLKDLIKSDIKALSSSPPMFSFDPPENMRKPWVFYVFRRIKSKYWEGLQKRVFCLHGFFSGESTIASNLFFFSFLECILKIMYYGNR